MNLPSLKLEGALFLPDQLEKAAFGEAKYQKEDDYQTPKGLKLRDDYSRAFQIACAQWKHFAPVFERTDVDPVQLTHNYVAEFLRDALGYATLSAVQMVEVNDRQFPISFLTGHVPIVVAPFSLGLDDADLLFALEGSGSRKKSAFQLVQELLNASDNHLWGMVTNGRQLRLLRDAASLTRPSFLEIDLEDVLRGQRFSEFAMVWRLLHVSRASLSGNPKHCIWEAWQEAGIAEGTRVRDGLRNGVEQALLTLGEGFLQHPANHELRLLLDNGELTKDAYFQQLLRLVYRLIFLFSVEERGLLHTRDDSHQAQAARRAYAQGYAMARLRDTCLKRRSKNRFDDQWQAMRIVFKGLANGEPRLALPALGGLFQASQCPNLDIANLSNTHFLTTIQYLRWANHNGSLLPVDYRNMGPEELGSVYESLLELVPEIDLSAKQFGFIGITSQGSTAGNARKTSGSYYTPDSLVQELIKSALEPVIEQRLNDNSDNPTEALLGIRVIDPACGSGHFLLAAARRLAETLAQVRAPEGVVKPQDYRHALREVISQCIFGVDRNPMALELARTALWLEGFEEGCPLSFLDHHLQCGDALLGLIDLKALEYGIPKAAFRALAGDDREVCKALSKANTTGLKQLVEEGNSPQFNLPLDQGDALRRLNELENLPENTTAEIATKEIAYKAFLQKAQTSHLHHAADMLLGAFLLTKTKGNAEQIPTTGTLILELFGNHHNQQHAEQLAAAAKICGEAKVFHWPLAFPHVFAAGGFDCVLGNPPWEHVELKEEEFFATRHRDVFDAKNKADRNQRIQWLSQGMLAIHLFPDLEHPEHECEAEKRTYREYLIAKRKLDASSLFAHVNGDEGGRFPFTGVGRVNTYALFSETIKQITAASGSAGFVVPTGIATDDSTKAFFGHISQTGRLVSLYDIENREAVFPSVHRSYKFCLITLGSAERAEFAFFSSQVEQLTDKRRRFRLTPEEFRLINPNTLTCPVFRSERDAELTKKIYRATPVLIDEGKEGGNPWEIRFMQGTHNMASDSHLFHSSPGEGLLPLYEAKMIHQFDHRWATYDGNSSRNVTLDEKSDPNFAVKPRYWVDAGEVNNKLSDKGWSKGWLMGWRDICRATDERTVIASVIPIMATGDTLLLMFPNPEFGKKLAGLIADQCSLVHDFVARQKVGGTHLKYHVKKQITVLSPSYYNKQELGFIIPRVIELTYTSLGLKPWAEDLGYEGQPFGFNPARRAILRAELDAYYAKLYGLTRDELRYILDPADVMGEDYPSETFRVLKKNEISQFGEYRTAKLVMHAFDRMTLAEEGQESYVSPLKPSPGHQVVHTYSPQGVIRDEEEARLAGLVMLLIREAGTLPRQQLNLSLTIMQNPANTRSISSVEDGKLIEIYRRDNGGMFEATRFERLQSFLRFFENTGAIRIEKNGEQISAVPSVTMPPGVITEESMAVIAGILLRVAHADLASQTSLDSDDESQSSTKHA